MNYNSVKNQTIKEKFVGREVIYNVSFLISELAKKRELLDYEDQEELDKVLVQEDFINPVKDSEEYHVQYSNYHSGWVWVDKISHIVSPSFDTEEEAYRDCIEYNDLDPYYNEAYEHWIVTDWLAKKLEEEGEMVGQILGLTVWGRACTGQAILLDSVISKICEKLEILEGQRFE